MLHRSRLPNDQIDEKGAGLPPASHARSTSQGPKRRSSGLKFFASSTPKPEPRPVLHKQWEAQYLNDLRANRPVRPGGSRPLPERGLLTRPEPFARASSAMSFRPSSPTRAMDLPNPVKERSASALSHRRAQSDMPTPTLGNSSNGRPLARQPYSRVSSRNFSGGTSSTNDSTRDPSLAYRESGMRWMEKQEARSLREALEDMDMREEAKIHADAQQQASELVDEHRNSRFGLPYKNPDYRNYTHHLEKGAHARSQSQGWSNAATSTSSRHVPGNVSTSPNDLETTKESPETAQSTVESATSPRSHVLWDSPEKKAYIGLSQIPTSIPSSRRRSSGPRLRNSSVGLFKNPNDKIYEEPDTTAKRDFATQPEKEPTPLKVKTRNSISKIRPDRQALGSSAIPSLEKEKRLHQSEIYKNPPSRSRDPSYVKNALPLKNLEPEMGQLEKSDGDVPGTKDGMEIRGDDIRAATSMLMKDRSPKLPSPTVVSDRPGRPIVSFAPDWKPKETSNQEHSSSVRPSGIPTRSRPKPQMPPSTSSAPIVPIIILPDTPSIQINEAPYINNPPIPTISIDEAPRPKISLPPSEPKTRPLPHPKKASQPSPANRPLPHHASTAPVHTSTPHWSPSPLRTTAQCAACALPISGRIVSAASQRFHPACFTCHHCATALECVAFYPEPDTKRADRIARIRARQDGNWAPEDAPGKTELDDGDEGMRFYCHLDFHELFSPRCRSCKTPIESEVVVACGGEWHVGHFFCAECGDPFDAETPFVEKDGYAWCVRCHAGRFSGKCKGCRKPVVEMGVRALGGEWHEGCFVCVECGGGFQDGRFFTRGDEQKPVCVGCEERRLKA